MTVWFIMVVAVFITAFALWKPNYILAVVSAASWILVLWYTRTTPFATIAIGSTGDTIIILICIGIAMGIILYTIQRIRKEQGISNSSTNDSSDYDNEMSNRHGASSNSSKYESASEYQARVRRVLNPKKRKR